jgi:hypothetical protein
MLKRLAQITIEDIYSKHNIRGKIINDIGNLDDKIAEGVELVNIYWKHDYYKAKNKRISKITEPADVIVIEIFIKILQLEEETSIQNVVGSLSWLGGGKDLFNNIKTVSELIAVVCETNLYDIISKNGRLTIRSNYQVEEEVLQYMVNTKYLPPLICKPIPKTKNMDSAYLTLSQSNILGNGNHHKGKQALDVLNILQSIPLSLDLDVLNEKEEMKPLDLLDPKNTKGKRLERLRNFVRMVKASKSVYTHLISEGNKFWLDWRFDKRGRVYSSGYHVNIQSSEYKKALINLHTKEVINCE